MAPPDFMPMNRTFDVAPWQLEQHLLPKFPPLVDVVRVWRCGVLAAVVHMGAQVEK